MNTLTSVLRDNNKVKCTLLGKIRLLLGICFNTWLLYVFGKELLNGGMYDEQWEYYYSLTAQFLIIVSCCISLIVDCMLFRAKKKVLLYILIASNVIFWFSFLGIFSCDSKTHISYYYPLGMIIAAVIGFISSFIHIFFFESIYEDSQIGDKE